MQGSHLNQKDKKDHCVKVFSCLMLRGQVHSAVQFITNRIHGGGVLSVYASTGVPGCAALDTLHQKHPKSGITDESAFLPCDALPPLDITADYVEHVAQGSAGPGGSTALQWHGYLLRYGFSSAHLQDAIAMLASLACHLANEIIDWENMHALMMASYLIALDKCPGVRPIGIGNALRQILCKVVALATCADLEKVCGIAQLCSGIASWYGGINSCCSCFSISTVMRARWSSKETAL